MNLKFYKYKIKLMLKSKISKQFNGNKESIFRVKYKI